jgi:hypothetical protein
MIDNSNILSINQIYDKSSTLFQNARLNYKFSFDDSIIGVAESYAPGQFDRLSYYRDSIYDIYEYQDSIDDMATIDDDDRYINAIWE